MKYNKLILAPGPTNILEKYNIEIAKEFPHHRTKPFSDLFLNVVNNLKKIIDNDEDLIIFTSSGSGAMESSVVNFFSENDQVLVIDTGFFGKRYKTICEIYKLDVIHYECPLGETYVLEDIKKIIYDNKNLKGIFVTHHETSTGVLNDIESLGKIINNDILLIVDSISGLVMHPFFQKKWNVDVVCGGSQKGFLVPPGLSFVGLSKKAKIKMQTSTLPKYYFSYELMLKSLEIGQTLTTPAIALLQGLLLSTNDILNVGLEKSHKHHLELRKYLENLFSKHNFELVIKNENNKGNVVVLVFIPEYAKASEICEELDSKHNIVIMPGMGEYVESMIRVGVIGPLEKKDLDYFFQALKVVFFDLYQKKIGEL